MVSLVFLIIAIGLFIVDASGVSSRVGLQSLGLACLAAALVAGSAIA